MSEKLYSIDKLYSINDFLWLLKSLGRGRGFVIL